MGPGHFPKVAQPRTGSALECHLPVSRVSGVGEGSLNLHQVWLRGHLQPVLPHRASWGLGWEAEGG